VVGAAVHHEGFGGQVRGELAGFTVRQGHKNDVVADQIRGCRVDEGQVRERTQRWLHVDQALTGIAVRGDRAHLELGVTGEQPQQFAARIPARARHCHRKNHGLNLARPRCP
jgi:hypothetical protein